MPIETVRIEAVRGIRRELTLKLGSRSLIVRGDNGTGKSSIVQALRWALRGEDEPPQKAGEAAHAYLRHSLEPATAPHVVVEFKGGASIDVRPGAIATNDLGVPIRAACVRATPFLLRRQLVDFLGDRPVDRFKYLENFLDIGEADTIQKTIADRVDSVASAAEEAADRRDRDIGRILGTAPASFVARARSWDDLTRALGAWATSLGLSLIDAPWRDIVASAATKRSLLEGDDLARRRVELKNAIEALRAWLAIPPPLDPSPARARLAEMETSATDAQSAALLEHAMRHFASPVASPKCPVCEQSVATDAVSARLRARLDELSAIRSLRAEVEAAAAAWEIHRRSLGAALRQAAHALVIAVPSDDDTDAVALTNRVLEQLDAGLAALPVERQLPELRDLLQAIERADAARAAIESADAVARERATLAGRLKLVAEALRKARQDVAKALLKEISAHVAELYREIHPEEESDEVTGAPTIEVQRRGGGTAHVRGSFAKKLVEDPRLVYSDGHLDTVGICVFLGLRRFIADRDGPRDPKLMVLDDIVLSVDLTHGRRLLDVLKNRFGDHQIILLTHNGLFFDWCIQRLPSFQRLVITRWSHETGPQLGDYLSSMERVGAEMEKQASPKLLAQAVMNLMDEWLGDARFAFSLSVPAKRGEEYTMTEIWEPFGKRMREIEKKMGVAIGDLAKLLDRLSDLPRMRNRLAAHDNEFAKEFPLGTVRTIAGDACKLVRTLHCGDCGEFVSAVPNVERPEIVRCKSNCEAIRYVKAAKQ